MEVEGQRYRLLSMAGVSAERLVAVAKSRFGERWKVRIAEDPVEVLTAATGNSPGRSVDLVLETNSPVGCRPGGDAHHDCVLAAIAIDAEQLERGHAL